ncbi:MAG: hypothetical protein HDR01_15605 [Lachnospiraceae bacterium]|nr:hypothetical protein [Lachnospiraceae bacterium]
MFNKQSEEVSKEEARRKKRKKAQLQAYGILTAGVLALVLVIVGICSGVGFIVKRVNASKAEQASEKNDKANEHTVSGDDDMEEETLDLAAQIAEANAEETEQTTEELQEEVLRNYVGSFIDSMTIEEKVAGLFFVTPESITGVKTVVAAGSSTSSALLNYPVGGIVYDAKNIQDAAQFKEVIYNTKIFSKYEIFVALTEEGGETGPLYSSGLLTEPVLSQSEIGATSGVAGAYSAGISIGTTLLGLGVNVNFAPVSDVTTVDNAFIAPRAYGSDVTTAMSLTKNMLKGMSDQSVYGCLKYFPGHSDVTVDTSKGRGVSKRTKEDLEKCEYEMVKMAIEEKVPFLMVSHVSMPEITGDNTPASLSGAFITDMLRDELGYQGIIITDYMNKSAIAKYYKHADAAVMAIQAGADMILVPSDFKKAYAGVVAAVEAGDITEDRLDESLYRIFMLKYKNSVDYSAVLEAEQSGKEAGEASESSLDETDNGSE